MSSSIPRLPRGPRLPRDATTSPTPTTSPLIARGGTARAAVSPRVTGGAVASNARRTSSVRGSPSPMPDLSSERPPSREALTASLKRETDQKEDLLVRIQNQEQTISNLKGESSNFESALHAAETRLAELYSEQSRMEEDLSSRMDIIEKLRTQVRELEKEKRDALRRYNEQTQTFDAERQSFYDNEQHLKSRIQTLTQSRRSRASSPGPSFKEVEPDVPEEGGDIYDPSAQVTPRRPRTERRIDEDNEPAEMTSLRLELSTLETSQSSLQNTVQLLQTELLDLKRVNNELQEENESYNILLREKTLNGQFDLLRHRSESPLVDEGDDDVEREGRPSTKASLNIVDEIDELFEPSAPSALADELRTASLRERDASPSSRASGRSGRPQKSRRALSTRNEPLDGDMDANGESLGDLPVAGPGLDLAAELGRAEIKFDGGVAPHPATGAALPPRSIKDGEHDKTLTALRAEVKSLKDANKALSLYASKIIDRIIAQDGFEHVLAVDYAEPDTKPPSPKKKRPSSLFFSAPSKPQPVAQPQPAALPRPAVEEAPAEKTKAAPASTAVPPAKATNPTPAPAAAIAAVAPPSAPTAPERPSLEKRSRRAISMDWKSFSFFGASGGNNPISPPEKKPPSPVLKARKLDTEEDEDDRKERERLRATMKLMGIEPAATNNSGFSATSQTPIRTSLAGGSVTSAPSTITRPYSLFGRGKSAPVVPGSDAQGEPAERQHATGSSPLDEHGVAHQGITSEFGEIRPDPHLLSLRHKRGLSSISSGVSTVWSVGREHDDESENAETTIESRIEGAENEGKVELTDEKL